MVAHGECGLRDAQTQNRIQLYSAKRRCIFVSQPPNADGNPCNGDNTGFRGYVSSTITRFSFSYMYASHGVFPPRHSRGVRLNHSCVSATASGETDSKSVFFGAT